MKIKGIEVDLAGTLYTIPPLALGDLEAMQERLAEWKGDLSKESVSTVLDAALAALKRNYPDMTRDAVAAIVDMGNMAEVMEAVMDVSGLKRKAKEAEQGEVPAPAV